MDEDEHKIGAVIGTVQKKLVLGIWGSTYSAILLDVDSNDDGNDGDNKDAGFIVVDLESDAGQDISAAVITREKNEWERVTDNEKRDVEGIIKKSIFDNIGVGTKIRCAGFDTNQVLDLIDEEVEKRYPIFAGVIINKLED